MTDVYEAWTSAGQALLEAQKQIAALTAERDAARAICSRAEAELRGAQRSASAAMGAATDLRRELDDARQERDRAIAALRKLEAWITYYKVDRGEAPWVPEGDRAEALAVLRAAEPKADAPAIAWEPWVETYPGGRWERRSGERCGGKVYPEFGQLGQITGWAWYSAADDYRGTNSAPTLDEAREQVDKALRAAGHALAGGAA